MNIIIKLKNSFSDSVTMSTRCMRQSFRSVDTIMTVVATPVIMMLMFVYVFGGAVNTGSISYIDYVLPGVILMCILSGVAYTAYRLNIDIKKGIIDRFRSMPIAKSSILGGHVLTSVVFNIFSVAIIILFALLMGFRSDAGILQWFAAIGIVLLFTLAVTWISIVFGLLAGSGESAGVFSYILLFMVFISSAFTPTDTMSGIVRAFAQNQPMTPIIESLRALLMGEPVGKNALTAVLWCTGILVVSYIAAMQIYKRKAA